MTDRPHDSNGAAALALFALGMTAGMLVLLIAFALYPEPKPEGIEEFEAIRAFAADNFVGDVSEQELLERALHGMLDDLDPYSRYYERAVSEQARREIDGDFRGIGVVFRPPVSEGQILFPVEDSPARDAGMRVGDRILEIDGESVTELDGGQLRDRLAPKGRRSVYLRVLGLDGKSRELEIIPRLLVDPTVRHAHLLDEDPSIGYLTVRSFSNNTASEFDAAIEGLIASGARALVVDLRFNYGGVLDGAVAMVGRFLEDGVVVTSEGRRQHEIHRADDIEARFLGLPTCVLVDGESASASEIFAGALQDHRAAVVVGEPTFGKGMLQTTRLFPRFGSRAKVTSGYFYSPSHRNFERTADPDRDHGILPDLLVEIDDDARREIYTWIARYDPPTSELPALLEWEAAIGEPLLAESPEDPQLDAAVALLHGVQPLPYAARSTER